MGFPLSITGSVRLPSDTPDIHVMFADLEMALKRHRPREVRREGLDLTFRFGVPTLARSDSFFRLIDSGRLFARAEPTRSSLGFELRLASLAFGTLLFLLVIGALALTGRVTDPLALGLFVLVVCAMSAGCYLWASYEFKGFVTAIAGRPPNKRLEPTRRMIKE